MRGQSSASSRVGRGRSVESLRVSVCEVDCGSNSVVAPWVIWAPWQIEPFSAMAQSDQGNIRPPLTFDPRLVTQGADRGKVAALGSSIVGRGAIWSRRGPVGTRGESS